MSIDRPAGEVSTAAAAVGEQENQRLRVTETEEEGRLKKKKKIIIHTTVTDPGVRAVFDHCPLPFTYYQNWYK